MPGNNRTKHRYESLRSSRRGLRAVAALVRYGLISVGFTLFLGQGQALLSDVQFTWAERRILGVMALSYLGGFGLAGWVASRLIATAAELIDVVVDQAEATQRAADLIEGQAIPALGRIALALEKLAIPPATPAPAPTPAPSPPDPLDDDRDRARAVARRAIKDGRWAAAEKLVGIYVRGHPGPEAGALLSDLEAARHRAVADLKGRLEAARQAEAGEEVVDLRDSLTQHLRGADLEDLDRSLVRWLVSLIQARVKSAAITPDLAALAARVADSFGDTPEGAALRKSIPNLRRSAGLCPGCGRPYHDPGGPDACPRCRMPAPGARPAPVPLDPDP